MHQGLFLLFLSPCFHSLLSGLLFSRRLSLALSLFSSLSFTVSLPLFVPLLSIFASVSHHERFSLTIYIYGVIAV